MAAALPFPTCHLADTRVLVIDANQDDRALLADFLGQHRCRVYVASDPHDGLAKALLVRPDIILMGVHGRMGGSVARVWARLQGASAVTAIPVLFLTAAARPDERVECVVAGGVDYASKPFDFRELLMKLTLHVRTAHEGGGLHAGGLAPTATLAPDVTNTPDTPNAPDTQDTPDTRLDAALFRAGRRALDIRLAQHLDNGVIAREAGTTVRRLNLAFQRCSGLGMAGFLTEDRLREARKLVCSSSTAIPEIGKRVGLAGDARFPVLFYRRFGLHPDTLRLRIAQHAPADLEPIPLRGSPR